MEPIMMIESVNLKVSLIWTNTIHSASFLMATPFRTIAILGNLASI